MQDRRSSLSLSNADDEASAEGEGASFYLTVTTNSEEKTVRHVEVTTGSGAEPVEAELTLDDAAAFQIEVIGLVKKYQDRMAASVHPEEPGKASAANDTGAGTVNTEAFRQLHLRKQAEKHGLVAAQPQAMKDLLLAVTKKSQRKTTLFYPEQSLRIIWDLLQGIIVMYSVIIIPYRIAFESPPEGGWFIFETILDITFLMDIGINFNTAFYRENSTEIVTDRFTIAVTYLKGWFFVDLLCIIPFEIMGSKSGWRIVKMLKLVRLLKVMKFVEKFEEEGFLSPSSVQMQTTALAVFLGAHILACGWFMVGVNSQLNPKVDQLSDPSTTNWIENYGMDINDKSDGNKLSLYIASVYWCFTTLTTVGYGDIVAKSVDEVWYSIVAMLFGALGFGYIIGNVTTMMERAHETEMAKQQMKRDVKMYCRKQKVDKILKWKVKQQIAFQLEKISVFDEDKILSILPVNLKNEVVIDIIHNQFAHVDFLANKPDGFLTAIMLKLKPVFYQEGEHVFQQHDTSTFVIFILQGKMALTDPANEGVLEGSATLLDILGDGDVIGEVGVMLDVARPFSVHALTCCQTLRLERDDVEKALGAFPELHGQLKQTAEEKREKQRSMSTEHLSTENFEGIRMDFQKSFQNQDNDQSVENCPVFEPQSKRRLSWDFFLGLLILYSVAVVPYRLAFVVEADGVWLWIELMMDAMFLADICLNFNTAFYNQHDQLVTDREKIWSNYLKRWFWIDLASTIPFQVLLPDDSKSTGAQFKVFRVLKVFRMIKIIRLLKLNVIFTRLEDEDVFNPNVMRLAKLLIYIAFIAHIVGCSYFWGCGTGTYNRNFNNNESTWWPEDKGIVPLSPVYQYAWTMYWSVMLLTTVGYGDVLPVTDMERLANIFFMLMGALIFGYIVGNITTVAEEHLKEDTERRSALTNLNAYMNFRGLDSGLQVRVRKTWLKNYAFGSVHENESAIKINGMLSETLREEVRLHNMKQVYREVTLFDGRHSFFLQEMGKLLVRQTYLTGDVMLQEGHLYTTYQLFMIMSGRMRVFKTQVGEDITAQEKDEGLQEQLLPGDYFNEDIFINTTYKPKITASVVPMETTELYSLVRIRFISLLHMTEKDGHETSIAQEAVNFLADLENGNLEKNRQGSKTFEDDDICQMSQMVKDGLGTVAHLAAAGLDKASMGVLKTESRKSLLDSQKFDIRNLLHMENKVLRRKEWSNALSYKDLGGFPIPEGMEPTGDRHVWTKLVPSEEDSNEEVVAVGRVSQTKKLQTHDLSLKASQAIMQSRQAHKAAQSPQVTGRQRDQITTDRSKRDQTLVSPETRPSV